MISILVTFGLLYDLALGVEKITAGDRSTNTIVILIIECLALFIVPLLFNNRRLIAAASQPLRSEPSEKEKEQKRLKIRKRISMRYQKGPKIIKKCPNCGFENPAGAKICFNCGFSFINNIY